MDDFFDLENGELDHGFWSVCEGEELRCDFVDTLVCTLRREEDCDEEGVGVFVFEGNCGVWIVLV